ncbi:MAG: alanine dehydrogenase [Bacteroidales bacterium]|nr:alanine dehydrogenase [Bacteroidales bacterium]MCF6343028.1 alanine dehydrogenase [Bacteroidales bacterium]
MNEETKSFLRFSQKEQLLPQEETLATLTEKRSLSIGVPKEISENEHRVALVPEAANLLVENGHRLLVEEQAGVSAHFTDEQFSEAGAEIVSSSDAVFKADLIIKIAPPTPAEIEKIEQHKTLFSTVNLAESSKAFFQQLMAKKVTAVAYDYIQDKSGAFPVIKSMSEIIGNMSVMVGAEYLSNPNYGKGVMLGGFPGIKPTEVVIIGAGTVAEYAARTALGMGALVKLFDNSIYKLRDIQKNLGARVFTSILQPKVLLRALKEADVVIAAKHSASGVAPCFISEEVVRQMKQGSVIVDVSIDHGGCFETSRATTHQDPVFTMHGVTHYCVPNIASRVPRTASLSMSNFLTPTLLNISEAGGIEKMLKQDMAFCQGVYIYNGILTNKHIGELYGLPSQNLELLMAAFR